MLDIQSQFTAVVDALAKNPKPPAFRDSLTSDKGWRTLTKYGIAAHQQRLEGFLATALAETGRLRDLRESLYYTTTAAIKSAFKRLRHLSEAELEALLRNEHALGRAAYTGWPKLGLGNRDGTDDGYIFRGGGYIQTTGRDAYIKWGRLCDPPIDFSADPPPNIDDTDMLLIMSAAEWQFLKCNDLMDQGKFDNAQAAVNVGNPQAVDAVNQLDERRELYRLVKAEFESRALVA